MTSENRLARALGALSLAADQGAGQPQGTTMLAAVLAVRIGRKCGLSTEDLVTVYYGSIVRFIGCTVTSPEAGMAGGFGEDAQLMAAVSMCDWTDPKAIEQALEEHFIPDNKSEVRQQTIAAITDGYQMIAQQAGMHCAQAIILASRLPIPSSVVEVLNLMHNRWDGNFPGPGGDDIPLTARITAIAAITELFRRAGGVFSAIEMIKLRNGSHFDPALCDLVIDNMEELFSDFGKISEWDLFLGEEPSPYLTVNSDQRTEIAQCFADYIDQKSSWLLGHSRHVASLALKTATQIKLSQEDQHRVYIAGLLHDIGRIVIPNRVWDKECELTPSERREANSHSYHTEVIISEAGIFDDVINLVECVHERLDASGYHRRGRLDTTAAACLATADMYSALVSPRSWRNAHTPDAAANILLDEVKNGRLPAETVQGILHVTGQVEQARKSVLPAGLTQREADVLACLIRGQSNKQISEDLGISPKTVENHLTSVYDKTGTSGRAQASLYALKQGIFTH